MKIEVLCSAMNADCIKLAESLNLHTDAVIINQCDKYGYEKFTLDNNTIRVFSFAEKGIGRSRNSALIRANGDILLFADDNIKYTDNYADMVLEEFNRNKNADVIVFDIACRGSSERKEAEITSRKKLSKYNSLRYGAVRFAVKKEALYRKNINFSLLFGGGAQYNAGEDNIFLTDCISSGLKVYTSPYKLCEVEVSDSSWFKGFDKKYFSDKGALMAAIFKKMAYPWVFYIIIKNYSQYKSSIKFWDAVKYSFDGIKKFING